MISAEKFLDLLEEKDLLPSDMVAKLRRQVAKSPAPVPATAIAKRLIEKGYLTRPLAKRLLATSDQASKPKTEPEIKESLELSDDDDDTVIDDEDLVLEVIDSDDMALLVEESTPAEPPPPEVVPVEPPPLEAAPVEGEIVTGDVVSDAEMQTGILADPALDVSNVEDAGTLSPARRKKGIIGKIMPARDRRRKANVWDSSLLLLGGGGLAILVILAGIFIWVFYGNTGDAMVEEANTLYKDGSYQRAIAQYDEFIKRYPDHPQASAARVSRGLAKIRNITEGSTDFAKSLGVTVEVLGEISPEKNFGDARDELRSLLPTLAEGLAKQAHEKTSLEYVEKTREALALVDKHVSKSDRPVTRLEDINSSLAMTERRIARDDELAKAVAAMQKAIEGGKTPQAYVIRRTLLKEYPDLLDNEDLRKAVLAVTQAEKTAVKLVSEGKKAQTNVAPPAVRPAACIAQQILHKKLTGVKGEVVFVVAEGAVYGLDAAEGIVLWRRDVGYNTNAQRPSFPPIPVSKRPGSDVLLADVKSKSLIRVEAATGKIRWRQEIGERFDARPVIDGTLALIATESGRLVNIDLTPGDMTGYIQLPQKLNVAPVVDKKRSRIYQLAEHSNLYVLSSTDGKCQQVLYLGHETGSISAAGVMIDKYLVFAENRGVNSVVLRVLLLDPKDDKPAPLPIQEVELEGHVDTAPVVTGARMLLTTDKGRLYALRISASSATRPLEKIGQLQTSTTANLVRYSLLLNEQFWVADDALSKYEIQSSLSSLKPKWNTAKDSVFLQPLAAGGGCIFSTRRRIGLPGVIVSAIGMNQPDVMWETRLAVGPATEPTVDKAAAKITLVTKLGGIVEIPAAKLAATEQSIIDKPVVTLSDEEIQHSVDGVINRDGLLALSMGHGSEQLAVFDPKATPIKFRPMVLPEPLAARPIVFGEGLLVPCTIGQVFNLD
ncbi:MAG: PQQ-binding-like beta-propeller repeat protein, partial [Pirellulales bacterium]|nr:PQQ-binding-like beta-propeller repeat protein [Pirellulales bacterium]